MRRILRGAGIALLIILLFAAWWWLYCHSMLATLMLTGAAS